MRQNLNEVRRNANGLIVLPRVPRNSIRNYVYFEGRRYHSVKLSPWHQRKVFVEIMPWDNSVVYVYDTKGREICAAQLDGYLRWAQKREVGVMNEQRGYSEVCGHLESTKSMVDEIKKAFVRFPRADWIEGYTLTRLGGKWRLAIAGKVMV